MNSVVQSLVEQRLDVIVRASYNNHTILCVRRWSVTRDLLPLLPPRPSIQPQCPRVDPVRKMLPHQKQLPMELVVIVIQKNRMKMTEMQTLDLDINSFPPLSFNSLSAKCICIVLQPKLKKFLLLMPTKHFNV